MEAIYFKPSGKYNRQVKGESNYQENLADQAYFSDDQIVDVDLFLEDHNQYDSNAVVVTVDGKEVGYLSKADAVEYRARIKALGHPVAIGACKGKITGGHELNDGRTANYGIVLDLDIPALEIDDVASSKPKRP
jgi:hypothetical protein